MSSLVDWLNNHQKDHEIFKDVVKISEADVTPMDDGQVVIISDIKRANLTLETSSGEQRTLSVIVKSEAPPGTGRDLAKNFNAFTTEIMMYSDILKSMEKLMLEVGDKDIPWPECYYCNDNKLLFEDLCEIGFKIVPTYEFLDLNHSFLVMKTLGKFHGISIAMKERGILDINKLNEPNFAKKDPMMNNMMSNSINSLVQTIRDNWGSEWSSVADRLSNYFKAPGDEYYNVWVNTKGKWEVLTHGDFTMRNMMFHYPNESSQPDGIKFVDFQMCYYGSLGFDLATILYTSLQPSVREDNMNKLLTTYTESLAAACKQHGYTGPTPTVQDVSETLASINLFSTAMALFQLPFFVASKKQDVQKRATEFIDTYTCDDGLEKSPKSSLHDFSDKDVEAVVKSEILRCMKQNIF